MFAVNELEALNLVHRESVTDGFVVRIPFAYPMYEQGYKRRIDAIRSVLSGISNLETAGRAGMFRYNNMDHSILTGLVAVRRLMGEDTDIWTINADNEYLEG